MKSESIVISTNEGNIDKVLEVVEAFSKDLDHKAGLRIRLLAEETMNLIRSITGEMDAEFFLERDDNQVRLHLNTNTIMFAAKRKELMEISTSKENAAAKGFMGKIREVFELAMLPKDERSARESRIGMMGLVDPTALSATSSETWKMSNYKDSVDKMDQDTEFAQEARNELERSILGNIAKEVEISIIGDDVKMTIIYDL
ncbi:MAG: hypothetical protein J6M44_00425 [Butyrivibrio sp.]|uniref:hypothetical protein n=1 Tax=Butyrivibrio sp. TaxID=28121 RepID=UPI001B401ADD|nr:hypothetical protein [Butyrivibrio sp.]MBP3277398.1 hypothetical protein [Butyrivibrio sp.]MBP3782377.1 hypothetical protein [Butyrivibrio sp.]